MEESRSCGECRFWIRREESNIGDCRKNPPSMVQRGEVFNMRVWPNTYDIDWCDAFKKVKEKKYGKVELDKDSDED